jgi:hypothetical protein
MVLKMMSRIDDQGKLSTEEQAALRKCVSEHPGSTLLKDERTAQYLQRMRLKEQGQAAAKPSEILRDAAREEKYGSADWTQFDVTKPPEKQPSTALWDALERFIQGSDTKIEDFRRSYPAFLPPWFYDLDTPARLWERWERNDDGLRSVVRAWQAWQALVLGAWRSGFHIEYTAQLVNIPTALAAGAKAMRFEIAPVCDAQRAVLAITLESWRARFCPKCGRPFVARYAANKFCSTDCFAERRREKQRASKRSRARKRQAKAQARGRAKR